MVVVDNYSVHKSERVRWSRKPSGLEAADVYLVYLPPYTPDLSRIEAQWKVAKYHYLVRRSYKQLGELKPAVEIALLERAIELCLDQAENAQLFPATP